MMQVVGLLTQREPMVPLQVLTERYTVLLNSAVPADDVNPATGFVTVASVRYRELESLGMHES